MVASEANQAGANCTKCTNLCKMTIPASRRLQPKGQDITNEGNKEAGQSVEEGDGLTKITGYVQFLDN